MKNNTFFFTLILLFLFTGCKSKQSKDKYLSERNNIVDASKSIKKVKFKDYFYSGDYATDIKFSSKYIIVTDQTDYEGQINVIDRKTNTFLGKAAPLGQGPYEITRLGGGFVNDKDNLIYIKDDAKHKIFQYNLDSIAKKEDVVPVNEFNMSKEIFPSYMCYLNDSIAFCRIITATSVSTFNSTIGLYNYKTTEATPFDLDYKKLRVSRQMSVTASKGTNRSVIGYARYDLLVIYDLQGNLITNVHGDDFTSSTKKRFLYYYNIAICDNFIAALFLGEKEYLDENDPNRKPIFPTCIQIFDLNGNYIKTLDFGHPISDLQFDEYANRLYMRLPETAELAYINTSIFCASVD